MGVITPNLTRIIRSNEGRKHSGCKAKRHLAKRSFDAYLGNATGIANLSTSITLNSVTVVPRYFYRSVDLASINQGGGTCSWPCYASQGMTIGTYVNNGSNDLTTGKQVAFDTLGVGVQFPQVASADYDLVQVTSSDGKNKIDIADGNKFDFVFEISFFLAGGIGEMLGLHDGGSGTGYALEVNANNGLSFWLAKVSAANIEIATNNSALTANSWNHALLIVDRSGSAAWYINGKLNKVTVVSGFTETTWGGSSGMFQLGASGLTHTANTAPGFVLNHVALWSRNAWLDTHLQDAFVRDRYADLMQLHPDYCNGTAIARSL